MNIEYRMPAEVKKRITTDFLIGFKAELQKQFSLKADNTYYNAYMYLKSTVGWGKAFVSACAWSDLDEVFERYNQMNWEEAEFFDSELCEMMLVRGVIQKGEPEDAFKEEELTD